MGPYVYQLQAFQVTFTTAVAATYTISTARNGNAGQQITAGTSSLLALAEALYVPTCSFVLGAGFSGSVLSAGVDGVVEVVGRDKYGAHSIGSALSPPATSLQRDWGLRKRCVGQA